VHFLNGKHAAGDLWPPDSPSLIQPSNPIDRHAVVRASRRTSAPPMHRCRP